LIIFCSIWKCADRNTSLIIWCLIIDVCLAHSLWISLIIDARICLCSYYRRWLVDHYNEKHWRGRTNIDCFASCVFTPSIYFVVLSSIMLWFVWLLSLFSFPICSLFFLLFYYNSSSLRPLPYVLYTCMALVYAMPG
jgi:hypothetical protein